MSPVRLNTIGTLAAAALLAALAGCQRADERAGLDRNGAPGTPSEATHQASARHDLDPTQAQPQRKRDLQQTPAKATTAAAPAVSQRAAASGGSNTRTMGGPPAAGTQAMGAAADRVDDASITRQVNAAIAADQQLRAVRVDVDTQNGIVTLSGPAPTATAKEHAGEVARTIHGVISVNNQLTLASG